MPSSSWGLRREEAFGFGETFLAERSVETMQLRPLCCLFDSSTMAPCPGVRLTSHRLLVCDTRGPGSALFTGWFEEL